MIVFPFWSILPLVGEWSPWLLLCSCCSGTHRSASWPGWIKELARRLYFIFRWVEWSAVVLMLGLMDLFATAFISFTSKNWQAVKWNFGLDFQLDCLETFVKIFCFCVAAASSTVIVLKGRKVIYCTGFCWVKKIIVLGTVISCLHHIYYSVCSVRDLIQQVESWYLLEKKAMVTPKYLLFCINFTLSDVR